MHSHGYGSFPAQSLIWRCQWCGYAGPPLRDKQWGIVAILVGLVLALVCLPLGLIGLALRESVTLCPACGRYSQR